MSYKIIVSPLAKEQTTKFYYYYNKISNKVAKKFRDEVKQTTKGLRTNPFYQIRTKKYRAIPLKNFPFLLFFEVDESTKTIKIIALFNTHQDPEKYPQ
jgi:plasmid stabilization system protein ParE